MYSGVCWLSLEIGMAHSALPQRCYYRAEDWIRSICYDTSSWWCKVLEGNVASFTRALTSLLARSNKSSIRVCVK